jgi:hypothetical protein
MQGVSVNLTIVAAFSTILLVMVCFAGDFEALAMYGSTVTPTLVRTSMSVDEGLNQSQETLAVASAVLSLPFSIVNARRLMEREPSGMSGFFGALVGLWTTGIGVRTLEQAENSGESWLGGVVTTIGVAGLVLGVLNIVGDAGDAGHREYQSRLSIVRCIVVGPTPDGLVLCTRIGF